MSGSAPNAAAARAPRTVIRAQSAGEFGYGVAGQTLFFSSSVLAGGLDVAGQGCPEAGEAAPDRLDGDGLAAPRSAPPARRAARLRRSARPARPAAIVTRPSSSSIGPGSTLRMCPSRTTFSMLRSRSAPTGRASAPSPWWAPRPRSIRSITPAASSRRNRSGSDAAAAAASTMSATMPVKTAGSGWTMARLSIHGSRGRTQQMRSGSTPLPSSQTQASVAVLPEPTTTYWRRSPVERHQLVDRDHVAVAPRRRTGVAWSLGSPARGSAR